MSPGQRSELLATERGRLFELTDPVEKTKTYVRISEVLLTFAFRSFEGDEMEDMQALLGQYLDAVRGARETIVNSGRNARRQPGGFREFEEALRRQIRFLEDMNGQSLDYSRKPILDTTSVVKATHEEIRKLLGE
jgi:hypothetical protein